jgi:ubiquinone/menaquinone biosynthesis C-methylase UbiE
MVFDPRTAYQDIADARRYDRIRFSSLSGRVLQRFELYALQRILRCFTAGAVVLDAPCGTGRHMPLFVRSALAPIGGDISRAMLSVARERMATSQARDRFLLLDVVQTPFADGSVDAVFSIRFLPHLSPAERILVLQEFYRISRRWVVISLSISSPWHRIRRRIKTLLRDPQGISGGYPATALEIASELEQAGLHEVGRYRVFPVLSGQLLLVCEKGLPGPGLGTSLIRH